MTHIRIKINQIVNSIIPHDDQEATHINFVKDWLASDAEIFRITKPDNPPIHLVSYFMVVDQNTNEFLLVDHKLAGLWLPAGGHVEYNEHPKDTVRREIKEELGTEAEFLLENPLFISVAKTVGNVKCHTDVSFWYVLKGDKNQILDFDQREFHHIQWFDRDKIPYEKSDPHLKRFVEKALKKLPTLNSYESSVKQYEQNTGHMHPVEDAESFAKLIPQKANVIDLGCGTGRDAHKFREMGLKVTGIDLSPRMIEAAKIKVPQGNFHVMDLESFTFDPETFHGAWANCSLLHIPMKNIPVVLRRINRVLKPNGIFYMAVKKHDLTEMLEPDARYNGLEKFWTYFDEKTIQDLLKEAGFVIQNLSIYQKSSTYQSHPLIKVIAKKQS